jgi:hypothetical protein
VQGARAASIEAHVMACESCRKLVATAVPDTRLQSIWKAVEDRVDAPQRSWSERLLSTLGMADSDARLVAAAPALHLSWMTSLAAVLIFAVWASNTSERGVTLFLIVAPIVPVLAVMGAYGPRIDPTYEMSVASPYPTLRLVLLRSATVVAVSGALALLASALVPQGQRAAAWLLPCLALVMLTLILTRWVPQPVAAAGVAAGYALPLLLALADDRDVSSVLTSTALQVTSVAIAGAALIVMTTDPQLRTALRRNR